MTHTGKAAHTSDCTLVFAAGSTALAPPGPRACGTCRRAHPPTAASARTSDSTLVFAAGSAAFVAPTRGSRVVLPRAPADRRARPPMPPDRGIMIASAWPPVTSGVQGPAVRVAVRAAPTGTPTPLRDQGLRSRPKAGDERSE